MVRVLQWLGLAAVLVAGLEQEDTNGKSLWGTLPQLELPMFLDGPVKNGAPWGKADPAGDPPNTGVTRRYEFVVSRGYKSPDGYNKSVILINDQFPGPLIEANWGDMIQVTVTNNITTGMKEGLSMHWHGLKQKKSQWYDGVPGISQCPIAPGKTFTYTFQADQYGTSWYHSHYSAQYADGLFGPMLIYGPVQKEVKYDLDLGPIIVADHFHQDYYEVLVNGFAVPSVFPNVDNTLINGKGNYDCGSDVSKETCEPDAGISKFRFKSGKLHRLRLINSGTLAIQKFSIDDHEMTVIANDFVPVKPYKTNVVTLGVGQRTDVIVKGTGSPKDAVWMRSELDMLCLNATATHESAVAAIYYEKANTNSLPKTTGASWKSDHCRNDPLETTIPYYPSALPPSPGTVREVEISLKQNATGQLLFYVDDSSFRVNYNSPVLLLTKLGNTSYPDSPQWNVYNFGSNSSVRMIFKNTFAMHHPMHLHGHNFWVLAEGMGEWDGKITRSSNPQRRDTHNLQPGTEANPSYLVLEWEQDNPGIWPLHCHMAAHVSAGLYLSVMERPDDVQDLSIPMVMAQTCRDWAKFTDQEVVNQIDSGL